MGGSYGCGPHEGPHASGKSSPPALHPSGPHSSGKRSAFENVGSTRAPLRVNTPCAADTAEGPASDFNGAASGFGGATMGFGEGTTTDSSIGPYTNTFVLLASGA